MDNQEFKNRLDEAYSALTIARDMTTDTEDRIINLDFIIEKMEEYIARAKYRIKGEQNGL